MIDYLTKEELDDLHDDVHRFVHPALEQTVRLILMARECLLLKEMLPQSLGQLLEREKKAAESTEIIAGLESRLRMSEDRLRRKETEANDALKALKAEQARREKCELDHDVVLGEKKAAKTQLDQWLLAAKALRCSQPADLHTVHAARDSCEQECRQLEDELFQYRHAAEKMYCYSAQELSERAAEFLEMEELIDDRKATWDRFDTIATNLEQLLAPKKEETLQQWQDDRDYWKQRALGAEEKLAKSPPECWRCGPGVFHTREECPFDPGPAHP